MKARRTAMIACAGLLIAALGVNPTRVSAQSPSAPAKGQIPARASLAGSWKFNHDESDDPLQEVRSVESQASIDPVGYAGSGSPVGGSGGAILAGWRIPVWRLPRRRLSWWRWTPCWR